MAFDGIVIANIKKELTDQFTGARISKITQPELDELMLTLKGADAQKRLLISANPSLPLIYLTEENKKSPMTAPNFCMLLRKHISGGRIVSITQPDMERILIITISHLDDMGDLREKKLIVELMGKHSNIIFCDEEDMILDSIKHISAQVSSKREVLPGRKWFIPTQGEKACPLDVTADAFQTQILSCPTTVAKAIYTSYNGISPLIANEICYRAGVDGDAPTAALAGDPTDAGSFSAASRDADSEAIPDAAALTRLADVFCDVMSQVDEGLFSPNMVLDGERPVEYASLPLTMYADCTEESFPDISSLLSAYYSKKSAYTRIHQKSSDLRHIVSTLLERARKKYSLQDRQLRDTDKMDKYRKYGELLHIYGYEIPPKSSGHEVEDYETGQLIKIPLDKNLSAMENASKYYDRYNKLKRTKDALTVQIEETKDDVKYLESIASALDLAEDETDLAQIREELVQAGYIKKHSFKKKAKTPAGKPHHYRSSDGFDMYVGRNNLQNDMLTFKVGQGNDWWFHAKGIPGSHVLVKCPDGDMPDRTFEEAGRLAGYYSRGKDSEKVEIDYLQKKNVKKPNKAKPGFVVYYTNYSLTIKPDITGIEKLPD